jgi:site-specific recombinase XerD
MKTRYYIKSVRHNGGIIRQTRWGWQAEINKAPHRLRQSFVAQEDAKNWVDQKQAEIYNDGVRGLNLTALQRIEAAKAIQTLGTVPLTAAVAYYMRHYKPAGGTRTLSAFFDDYMAAKAKANLRPRSIQGLRRFCGDLIKAMGDRGVHEITTADLEQWLAKCKFRPVTRNNHITYARGVFNAAIRAGLIEKNPATDLERPILDERVPGVFAVADVAKLLATAAGSREYRRLTPFLAIGFFAGIRTSELDALQWADIDLARRLITVPATIAKKRRQGYVNISDNLLAWLEPYAACMAGRVTPADSTRRRVMGHLLKATGVKWVQNGMRHSFGSYHLAAFGDPHQTANQMRHRGDTSVLLDHYRALVRPDEAQAYWKIKP